MEFEYRLDLAKEEGVMIDDLSMGDDGFLAWPNMSWDPDLESLHDVVQNRLIDNMISQELGDMLRRELVTKGSRILEEAQKSGVTTDELYYKEFLLAWDTPSSDTEKEASSNASNQAALMYCPILEIEEAGDAFEAEEDTDRISQSIDDQRSEVGSESDTESDDDDDLDIIWMDNLLHPKPYIEEDVSNILYDVEVIGGPPGHSIVDLEVYVAEDDSEYDNLPEVEFAIDKDGYEHYFGLDNAVEVEVPGTQIQFVQDFSKRDFEDPDGDATSSSSQSDEGGELLGELGLIDELTELEAGGESREQSLMSDEDGDGTPSDDSEISEEDESS